MKITHLCIYVPPVLGAYLLQHHSSKPPTFSVPTPGQSSQFFFLAVPCALEAQTVINTSCFDWRFPRKREKVRQ